MKNFVSIIFLLFFCVSCATPKVINVIGPNDNELSCKQLNDEIAKANRYHDEAQEAKEMNKSHNIGAVLFFLPGMGVTMQNITEATEAAKERAIHLNKIKEKKNC